MFLNEELKKQITEEWPKPRNGVVDIHSVLSRDSGVYMVVCDGERFAVGHAIDSPLSSTDTCRFATIGLAGTRTLPRTAPPPLKSFIHSLNGSYVVLHITKVVFHGRGPVLSRQKVPRFSIACKEPSTLDDSYEFQVPEKFTAERPSQFRAPPDTCILA